jgi:NAD-dependent SIR2 family protein deacetylase
MEWGAELDRAARWIQEARGLAILAGAGMGVDSGLPDFRGPEGFWKAYPPIAELGLRFEQMANPTWFRKDPAFGWGFYGHRLQLYRDTKPHAGFAKLLGWNDNAFVFTSNVDGHFQRSGFEGKRVLEIHGSIHHFQCLKPCCDSIWPADAKRLVINMNTLHAADPLPHCPRCGDSARPNVLMFNDGSWVPERTEAQYARWEAWLDSLKKPDLTGLVAVELGAGSTVPTVRATSEALAARGATLIRVNTREPEVPAGHIGLPMSSLAAITALDERLKAAV